MARFNNAFMGLSNEHQRLMIGCMLFSLIQCDKKQNPRAWLERMRQLR